MDKQMIEEMEKTLYDYYFHYDDCIGGSERYLAKYLIEKGWIKPAENAVVITREEFENLGLVVETVQEYESQNGQPVLVKERKVVKKSQTDFVELLNRETRELQISLQARKETAEKFAELAKAKLNEWLKDNEDNDGKIDFGIAEIELIGVKSLEGEVISESLIDEIAKEITEGKRRNTNETV